MTQITSFEHACQIKGISTQLPDVSSWPAAMRRSMIALYKLTIIRDAIVGNWVPDWDNEREKKWGCWFWLNKPGFRFYVAYYDFSYSGSSGGPRLCFETEEQATYCGKTFLSLWEEWLTVMSAAKDLPSIAEKSGTTFAPAPAAASSKELALEIAIKYAAKGAVLEEAKKIYEWLTAA